MRDSTRAFRGHSVASSRVSKPAVLVPCAEAKMGVCLCKSKTSDDLPDNISPNARHSSDNVRAYGRHMERYDETLSEMVDRLVKETLKVIGTIVDNEPEPPSSMVQLHDVTDQPTGWIQLVKSLIRVVPIEHPMGPSVITLLLDDSPLPTKDSVLEVADMITYSLRRTPRRERNLCVILGCLAEKLAGPSSIAVLSETTLGYLIGNLDEGIYPEVMLFSIIALEKFAQKSENKATIKVSPLPFCFQHVHISMVWIPFRFDSQRKLAMFPENPLIRLERHANSTDYVLRQVGYCARWCLDNYCKSRLLHMGRRIECHSA